MRSGADVPSVPMGSTAMQAVLEMSRGKMGMTAVISDTRQVKGIFTDGDLRRSLEKRMDFERCRVEDVMTPSARTITPGTLAVEAVHLMETCKVNQLLVVDERGELVGALNTHDLFRAKVI